MLNSITLWLKQLFHHHEWEVVKEGEIITTSSNLLMGHYYISRCKICGKHRREEC